jgi:hypothetical protein
MRRQFWVGVHWAVLPQTVRAETRLCTHCTGNETNASFSEGLRLYKPRMWTTLLTADLDNAGPEKMW